MVAIAERRIFHPPVQRTSQTIGVNDGKDWSWKELNHFGVFFKFADFHTFFDQDPKALGEDWNVWLTATDDADQAVVQNEKVWSVMEKLVSLHDPVPSSTQAIHQDPAPSRRVDLGLELVYDILRLFGYIIPGKTIVRAGHSLPFMMFGHPCVAKFDIVVMNASKTNILMGFQLDNKSNRHSRMAEIVPLAASIFVHNRKNNPGQLDYEERLVPIITMYGSTPTFYLVPMTQQLVDDMDRGKCPSFETVVLVYEPVPENNKLRFNLGMAQTENRLPISQAYLAFKSFLGGSDHALRINHMAHSLEDGDLII